MTQAEVLADALQGLFSNPEAGWFTPLSTSIQEISAEQVAQVPADRFNSVWALVNHIRFWKEFMFLSLQSQSVDRETLGSKNG